MTKKFAIKIVLCLFLLAGILLFTNSIMSDNRSLSKKELITYIETDDNNLIKHDSIDDINYSLSYKPCCLINQDKSLADSLLYFTLKCSYNNKDLLYNLHVPYSYANVLNNLSFNLKNYLFAVIDKKDTIRLAESLYARNYGMSNNSAVLLVFPSERKFQTIDIVLNDFVYDKGEKVKFKFKYKDIKNCPTLIEN